MLKYVYNLKQKYTTTFEVCSRLKITLDMNFNHNKYRSNNNNKNS